MTQEIMQESNPELKNLFVLLNTNAYHYALKFHTKREDYKTLWDGEWGGPKKQITCEGSKMRMAT